MPDKWGRPTFDDWVGIAGRISAMRTDEAQRDVANAQLKKANQEIKIAGMKASRDAILNDFVKAEATYAAGDNKNGYRQAIEAYDKFNDGLDVEDIEFDEQGNPTKLIINDENGDTQTVPAPPIDNIRTAVRTYVNDEKAYANMYISNMAKKEQKNQKALLESANNPYYTKDGDVGFIYSGTNLLTGKPEIVHVDGAGNKLSGEEFNKKFKKQDYYNNKANIGLKNAQAKSYTDRSTMTKEKAYQIATKELSGDELNPPTHEAIVARANQIYNYAHSKEAKPNGDFDSLAQDIESGSKTTQPKPEQPAPKDTAAKGINKPNPVRKSPVDKNVTMQDGVMYNQGVRAEQPKAATHGMGALSRPDTEYPAQMQKKLQLKLISQKEYDEAMAKYDEETKRHKATNVFSTPIERGLIKG